MPRWKPDARRRLVVAALGLFAEQGYDGTTVAQIAERAELTRSTFFRHFSDKREILSAGQDALGRLLAEGIAEAPTEVGVGAAVAAGLDRACSAMSSFHRELGPMLRAATEANEELRVREAMKGQGLAHVVAAALRARMVPEATAAVAGELAVLAFRLGYARWAAPQTDDASGLARHTRSAWDELIRAAAELR